MSNSELPKVIDILLRSSLEFSSDGCLIASSLSEDNDRQLQEEEENKKDGKCEGGGGVSSSFSDEETIKMRDGAAAAERTRILGGGELEVDEVDDDGFRTPTSMDHRIPISVIQQCPPAPRKPKCSPKRKASSSSSTRRQLFLLDFSQEIESLFPPALLADLSRKIKKVRQDLFTGYFWASGLAKKKKEAKRPSE